MSGFLGALAGGAVQVRGAMLRGQSEGEDLARQRAREERLHRAQEAAAALTQQRFDYERARDAAQDARQHERDALGEQVRLGDLATRGVFRGPAPADPKNPTRYRDLGNGFYYDSGFSPTHRTELENAARLATTIARRNRLRGTVSASDGATGTGDGRPMSLGQAERARADFADRALEAASGDPQRAMALLNNSAGQKARAAALGMTWPDYLAARERFQRTRAPRPTEKGQQAQQLRDYLRAQAQLRGQGKSAAEIRATLGPPPI